MAKQKQVFYSTDFLKTFLRDKWSLWTFSASVILLLTIYWTFFHKEKLVYFPVSEKSSVQKDFHFYNDRQDGGNSVLVDSVLNDSCVSIRFILKKGFGGGYAGIWMGMAHHQFIDVSGYNRLLLEASGEEANHFIMYLVTKDKHVSDSSHRLALRHSYTNFVVTPEKKLFVLKIEDFKTPDWWFEVIDQSPSEFDEPEWNRLTAISFASGINTPLERQKSLRIYRISFERDNTAVVLVLAFLQALVLIFLLLRFYLKTKTSLASAPLIINYQAVSVEEKKGSLYSFLDYIHQHFSDSELSLLQVSKQTGISQRNITETISEKYQCNFKTYVNQIRINEALRLLKTTELHISEIAYKVGFSSPGSFNRVFKTFTGKSPSEYKQDSNQ